MANVKMSMDGTTIFDENDEPADVYHLSPPGSRRLGRELALQTLYALEFNGNSVKKTIDDIFAYYQESDGVKKFAVEMIEKIHDHLLELDEHIRAHTTNWDFERIAVIDRLILRMAICEFLYFWDIPPKVSIDEAIELSKMYSTEQSSRFVNGVLDAVLIDLKKSGQLIKSGRGLQEGHQDDPTKNKE